MKITYALLWFFAAATVVIISLVFLANHLTDTASDQMVHFKRETERGIEDVSVPIDEIDGLRQALEEAGVELDVTNFELYKRRINLEVIQPTRETIGAIRGIFNNKEFND